MFKVPQTSGISGWLIFTYENGIPVCLWVTTQECRYVPCAVDERICGDTFFRAERVSPIEYVIADIFIYNSNCLHACSTFKQRYEWLIQFMERFMYTSSASAKFVHKSKLDKTYILKGYESHPNEIEAPGYFTDIDSHDTVTVNKTPIPDCYELEAPNVGYLRVPDMKTSVYLKTKGDTFKCKCKNNGDGSWTILENIPPIK